MTPPEVRRADYDINIAAGPNGEEVVKMLILPFGDEPPAPGRSVPPHFIAVENRQQSTRMNATAFNKSLPYGGGIHVTDNLSDLRFQGADFKPINRQHSHSLVEGPPYPDAGGPPATLGSTLDTTATFPACPGITINPIMTVPAPDPSLPPSVLARVAYTTTERLDLKIEPWNAPTEYATRSIWFERTTSAVPPVDPPRPTEVGNVAIPLYRDGYDQRGGRVLNRAFRAPSLPIDRERLKLPSCPHATWC